MHEPIPIHWQDTSLQASVERLIQQHPFIYPDDDQYTALRLKLTDDYLALEDRDQKLDIHVDFVTGALAHRRKYGGGRGQAIARALGCKQGQALPRVLDATAGLARDAFVIACLGCPVVMVEQSPVLCVLIEDALQRAAGHEDFMPILEQGFELVCNDSQHYMTKLDESQRPDVIYLDPMYPERKKSALVKKDMQLLQKLHGSQDADDLLHCALGVARKRVVVKRPKGAEYLADLKPTHSMESKKTRYDVYVIAAMTS